MIGQYQKSPCKLLDLATEYIQPHLINKGNLDKDNSCVRACRRLPSGCLHIVPEWWVGSSEQTMKLYTFDGLTQAGYAMQKPTEIVGAIYAYLDFLLLSIPYLSSSVPALHPFLCETVKNLLNHCPRAPSNSRISSFEQLTM